MFNVIDRTSLCDVDASSGFEWEYGNCVEVRKGFYSMKKLSENL